jgi:hypothetical protein
MVRSEKACQLRSNVFLIFWHLPTEWARFIYNYVERIGSIGSIFTVYDLIDGDDTIKEGKFSGFVGLFYFLEFHGIPDSLAKLAIAELEKTGKARLFSETTSSFKESGLKFF